ncbi:Foie gras liver health family 1-domain-containing protein [Halteromyces radiatus]|uniref:Foie gras liver health family 1-domain-containing protein n=1 Tax=Halteromyces radiatus TaxID=101107 RepID=UPI0022203B17|nr:Foie gras liver health family 1-domain-containing protein [Halteromyces radiatus]KAI8082919.1 Foie gras liver health family 1-domain-containing protein [Halteromyces radiatus]
MDSYPSEYLLHPVPVLAIYGLREQQELIPTEPSNSDENKFHSLTTTLLNILLARQDFSLYDASRYITNATIPPPFRVITVQKDYTLPERSSYGLHTPLSPLSSDSPLYPDGLMTPQWITKHWNLPSVVVGCYELWDWSQEPGSPPPQRRETGPLASHLLIDPTEREKDTILAHEINERRKYFQDKGIKFAAVILRKGKHLDGPAIEERCSMIRKQSGLDAKTSFFTLGPGSIHDLQEFVNILYRSLFESALQYYNNLIKRTRKKRSKLPSLYQQPKPTSVTSLDDSRPLTNSGWTIRYDTKIALFQEFKQDIEGALKTLEITYTSLADYLTPGTNAVSGLHVRSKRWFEARSLSDCLNIKICQFYLYLNDSSSALAQLNGHLHMFQSYSAAWGMGEQSFEYWAWLSKQYRIFADVIDLAIQHGFKVPDPSSLTTSGFTNTPGSPHSGSGMSFGINDINVGCNPGAILQHPGFYYHLAAMCCAERRRRFLEMNRLEASKMGQQEPTMLSSLLDKERRMDHSSLTIELLTKSYEQFKRYHNGRMTLYLAAEIAGTYYETGKFEMALKFFERIGKTYRKERWHTILTSILRWSLRCAKELGSLERAIECLVELLSDALPMSDSKRADIQGELLSILNKPSATIDHRQPQPILINMNQINAFVHCQIQFRTATNFVNAPLLFQITLQANSQSPPATRFRFGAMRILFSDPRYNYYLIDSNGDEDDSLPTATLIDCSQDVELVKDDSDYRNWKTKKVNLGLSKKQTKVIQGCVLPEKCEEVKIVGVCLDIISPSWIVGLNYTFDEGNQVHPLPRRKWLQPISDTNDQLKFKLLDGRGELNTVRIMQRPPCVNLTMKYSAPALLDETFPLTITLTSDESEIIDVTLHVEMKNVEGQVDEDYATFMVNDQPITTKQQAINELHLGHVKPNQSIDKTVYLYGSRLTGSRLITLTARYSSVGSSTNALTEKSEAIRIPFVTPFDTNFEVCAQNEKPDSNMEPYLPNTTASEKWLIVASVRCCSTWDLAIDKVEFVAQALETHNASLTLISKLDDFKWQTGHVYNANYLFRMTTSDLKENMPSIPTGYIIIYWKRYDQDGLLSQTTIQLPSLTFQKPTLSVLADVPCEIYLGEPITISYQINNSTMHIAEYTGSIELSEAFVFSGYKQVKGRVLPMTRHTYHYVCYPLLAGKVRLPRLKVIAKHQGIDKEISTEMVGNGTMVALDNDLHPRQGLTLEESSLVTYVFVNARRN